MGKFRVIENSKTHYTMEGVLDEETQLQEFFSDLPPEIWIDMSGIRRINSSGVRQFLKAILVYDGVTHLRDCSPSVVDQINMIPEFAGRKGIVESILMPFYCEDCGHSQLEKFVVGKDKPFSGGKEEPSYDCTECKKKVVFDDDPNIFFHFLGRPKKVS